MIKELMKRVSTTNAKQIIIEGIKADPKPHVFKTLENEIKEWEEYLDGKVFPQHIEDRINNGMTVTEAANDILKINGYKEV